VICEKWQSQEKYDMHRWRTMRKRGKRRGLHAGAAGS
jgi:hypothetical protein